VYLKESISEVYFSPNSDQLAVNSHSSPLIYFIYTSLKHKFQILAYHIMPFNVTGMSWNTSNKQLIAG
jgi:WD40 repeat protein